MERRINLGIFAHVDAGKTSITEQLLYRAGAIRTAGRVDSGTAQTDWLLVERRRGISVRASETVLRWQDTAVNLIDTPGHMDFIGEVERCLAVLDGAVLVLSAAEGIQGQTRLLWQALREMKIPTLLFLNKLDRVGASPEKVLAAAKKLLSPALLPLQEAIGAGSEEVSAAVRDRVALQEEILSAAAETDPEAEAAFLEEREVPPKQLEGWLRACVKQCQLFPVMLGSAKTGLGMTELLDGIVRLLPDSSALETDGLSGLVYRVSHDPVMGRGAHVRLFSGSLKNRDSIDPAGRGPQKISQIRRAAGARFSDLGELSAGELGVLYGLSAVRCGDSIGSLPESRQPAHLAAPLLTVKAFAADKALQPKLAEVLAELTEEDPLLDLEWVREKQELHLKITGRIQLEVLAELIRDRYGLAVKFSAPSIIYKETPASKARGKAVYLAPKPCWAIVELEVEPLPPGSGIRFESAIKGGTLPYQYQNHVAQALPEALQQGLFGWEVIDAAFTLTDGQSHHVHTHPLDFFVATPMAVMAALEAAGTTLLEPMLQVTMTADESLLGKVTGDIIAMRGSFDTPSLRDGEFTMEALLPAADSLNYPSEFLALSRGRGSYFERFAGYQPCPPELGKTAERRGVDPRDREKWILHRRGAV